MREKFIIFLLMILICFCPYLLCTKKTSDFNYYDREQKIMAVEFIGNKYSGKFHKPTCHSLPLERNRVYLSSYDEAIREGYTPCYNCIK